MSLTLLFSTILTLALLLAAGILAGKTKIIDETASAKLSTVTTKIGQPFLIINALISVEHTPENVKKGIFVLLFGIALNAFMALLAYFFAKGIKDADERKLSEFSMVFTNCGFVGFPILESLFGDVGLFYGAFFVFAFNVCVWTWGIVILARKRNDIHMTPRKILINYGTVPSVIGFLIFLTGVRLPDCVMSFSGYLAAISTPLAMLITGANLARRDIRKMVRSKPVYLVNFVKLIVMPVVTATLLWLIGLSDDMVIFGTVMAAMPSAAIVTMFGEMYEINPGYASELVGSTSLLCTVTLFPVIYYAQLLLSLR